MYKRVNWDLKSLFTKHISFKIFLSYFFIIAIVAIICAWTISSLSKFQGLQNQFSNENIQYLTILQDFSKTTSSYLVLVERTHASKFVSNDLQKRLFDTKVRSQELLAALKRARSTSFKQQVKEALDKIFSQVEDLVRLKNNRLRALNDNSEISISDIQDALKQIENTIKRSEIMSTLNAQFDETQSQLYGEIIEEISQIRLAISFVLPITPSTNLPVVRSQFLKSTASVISDNARIIDPEARQDISKNAAILLRATEPKFGLFKQLQDIQTIETQLADIVQSNYAFESELNKMLAEMVVDANAQTRASLNNLTDLTQQDVNRSFFGLTLALVTAILTIEFFVRPHIIERLQQLAQDTSLVASGKLQKEIKSVGDDEISKMSLALDNFRKQLIIKEDIEAQIRENEALLSNIFANAADGLLTVDQKGRIISFNQSCERIFERKSADMVGQDIDQIIVGFSSDKFFNKDDITGARATDDAHKYIGLRSPSETFPLELALSEVKLDKGSIYLCILRDITERERRIAEREDLISSLNASNTQLAQFAYVCSHDLQEPMRMISAFSAKLEKRLGDIAPDLLEDERLAVYIKQLMQGATNGQALIKDILAYSKLDHEKEAFQPVDCGDVMGDVQNVLDAETKTQIIIDAQLPVVRGIRTQIYQLFFNLVSNGLKYVPAGKAPQVHIRSQDEGTHWAIFIEDNGIGIDPKNFQSIFQMFRRLHRKDEYMGTGIGLTICKKIVDNHRGEISITSQLGEGSTFKITLLKDAA